MSSGWTREIAKQGCFSVFVFWWRRGAHMQALADMTEKKGTEVSEDEKQLYNKKLPFLFVTEPYLRLLLAAAGRLQC